MSDKKILMAGKLWMEQGAAAPLRPPDPVRDGFAT